MTTKARRKPRFKTKEELDQLRPEWLAEDVAEGLKEIERDEVVEIEIDAERGEYRFVQG